MSLLFIGLMLGGTFALGLSDVLTRKYLKNGLNEQAFLAITLFFTGALLLPILMLVGIPQIKEGFWVATTITVLLNLVAQNLFIRAFRLSEASLIAPLRLIIPPLVILTGFVFLGETPSLTGAIGIFVTVIGLWFLLQGRSVEHSPRSVWFGDKGITYGLIGSVLFAISFPFDKLAVVKSSALFATFIIFTILGFLTYAVNLAIDRKFSGVLVQTFTRYLKANILVSLCSSIGVLLTNQALNYSLVAYASSLKRFQALWTVIIAGRFLREKEVTHRAIATIIMFAGILLSVLWG